jgi:hypothetical protein
VVERDCGTRPKDAVDRTTYRRTGAGFKFRKRVVVVRGMLGHYLMSSKNRFVGKSQRASVLQHSPWDVRAARRASFATWIDNSNKLLTF